MFDNVKNAADDVPVIGTGDTVRAGKERADNDPIHALCDGAQSLRPEQYDDLAKAVRRVREAVAE